MFSKRKTNVPSGEVQEIDAHDMWVVSWWSRYGEYSTDVKKRYQSFFNKEDAIKFKTALEDANKLIGNTSQTYVNIEQQSNGL